MQNAWNEIITITDRLWRSQISGVNKEDFEREIKQADNNEHELLLEALQMIVTLRNKG